MKQAYIRKWLWDGLIGYNTWQPVCLTGLCKTVTGGPSEKEHKFYQARRSLFGILLWTYWIHADNVQFFDPVVETIYKCNK